MKARPYITERLLMGCKESNKKNVFPGSDNFGSNPLYFTFCIKTLPDMSSADNLCKRFGPKSGPTFCSGLADWGPNCLRRLSADDNVKLNQCILFLC